MKPTADAVQAGPGQFKAFPPGSRYVADGDLYRMRPDSIHFPTQDLSRMNDDRHRWSKLDTFQTPYGHLGADEINQDNTSTCSFGDLRALLRELLDEIRFELVEQKASLHEDFNQAVTAIRAEEQIRSSAGIEEAKAGIEELKSLFSKTMGDTQTAITSNLATVVGDSMTHLAKTIGSTEWELKTTFQNNSQMVVNKIDSQTKSVGEMDSQMKKVVDDIQMINDKLRRMPQQEAIQSMITSTGDLQKMITSTGDKLLDKAVKVDMQPVFEEVTKLNKMTERINWTLQSCKPTLEALAQSTLSSDLPSVMNAVASLDKKLAVIDGQLVVNWQGAQTQSSDVEHLFDAIHAIDKKVLDLKSGVSSALSQKQNDYHLDIHTKPIDTGPFLDALARLDERLTGNMSSLVDFQIRPVLKAISSLESKVDEIQKSTAWEYQPPRPGVEHMVSRLGVNEVISAVSKIKPSVDMGPVIDVLRNEIETPLVDAIAKMDIRPQLDLHPVIDAIKEASVSHLDIYARPAETGPVLDAVAKLEAKITQNKPPAIDFAPVLKAVSSLATIVNEIKKDSDTLKAQVGALEAPGASKVHLHQVDLQPVLDAIKALPQHTRWMVDLEPVLDTIKAMPCNQIVATIPKVDFAPVLSAIENIQVPAPADNMLPVFNGIAEIMQHLDRVSTPQLHDFSERLTQIEKHLASGKPQQGKAQPLAGSAGPALRSRPSSPSPTGGRGGRGRSDSRSPDPIRIGGGYELQDEAPKNQGEPPKDAPQSAHMHKSGDGPRPPARQDRYLVGSFVPGGGDRPCHTVLRPHGKPPADADGRPVNLYRVLQTSSGRGPADTPVLETWYK